MKDLRFNSMYPPENYPGQDTFLVINLIDEFCNKIREVRDTAAAAAADTPAT